MQRARDTRLGRDVAARHCPRSSQRTLRLAPGLRPRRGRSRVSTTRTSARSTTGTGGYHRLSRHGTVGVRDARREEAHRLPVTRRAQHPGRGTRRAMARDPRRLPLRGDGPYSRRGRGSGPLLAQHLARGGDLPGRPDAPLRRNLPRQQLRRVPAEDRRFASGATRGWVARGSVRRRQVGAPRAPVLVYRRAEIPTRIERVSLDTGQRKLFKEIAPADRAGLLSLRGVFVTDDMRSYAYTTYHQVPSLFVSEGGERPASMIRAERPAGR